MVRKLFHPGGNKEMKMKPQIMTVDGFDRSVAEKMPKMRKMEEPLLQEQEEELTTSREPLREVIEESRPREISEQGIGKKTVLESSKTAPEKGQEIDILHLVEDLHTQLLVSSRTQKALEMDLAARQKTIQQLAQDNRELRNQLELEKKEIQKFREAHAESVYLKEENEEALLKIQELQQELRVTKERLGKALQEREEALNRIRQLELQMDESELFKIKGKMKEREASHFYEENVELQSRLQEALAKNEELEKRYNLLKRSFQEVKESLTVLRDSYKKSYYNLTETSGES